MMDEEHTDNRPTLDEDSRDCLQEVANIAMGQAGDLLARLLGVGFSQDHPTVLGQHKPIPDLIRPAAQSWQSTLAIEISYAIENHNVNCDLLLLYTEESLPVLKQKIAYMLD